jgi:hypothetical protein
MGCPEKDEAAVRPVLMLDCRQCTNLRWRHYTDRLPALRMLYDLQQMWRLHGLHQSNKLSHVQELCRVRWSGRCYWVVEDFLGCH